MQGGRECQSESAWGAGGSTRPGLKAGAPSPLGLARSHPSGRGVGAPRLHFQAGFWKRAREGAKNRELKFGRVRAGFEG